jgi:hypothetical protein
MFNLMGAVPIGPEARFQPYISGGLGAIFMRADVINVLEGGTIESNMARPGGNIGGGFGVATSSGS